MESILEWLSPSSAWFLLGVLLFLIELALPSFFLVFFGFGAWLTSLFSLITYVDESFPTQLIIFSLSSILSLVILRKQFTKIFNGTEKRDEDITNEDFLGKQAIVTQSITANKEGKVEVHGSNWKASADENIAKGASVEIIEKKNLTLKVKAL